MRSNKLSLNDTKTELFKFRSPWKYLPCKPGMTINNYNLGLLSHIKYLNILIDKVLSWNKQIGNIYTKLARANDILLKLHHLVPKKHVHQYIYFCFTLCPSRLFDLVVFHSKNMDRIIILQKPCIQIIMFTEHTSPLFSELKMLKVKDIFSLTKLLLMFSFINENVLEKTKNNFCH